VLTVLHLHSRKISFNSAWRNLAITKTVQKKYINTNCNYTYIRIYLKIRFFFNKHRSCDDCSIIRYLSPSPCCSTILYLYIFTGPKPYNVLLHMHVHLYRHLQCWRQCVMAVSNSSLATKCKAAPDNAINACRSNEDISTYSQHRQQMANE